MIQEFQKWVDNRHEMVKDWKEKNNGKVFGCLCCVNPEELIYAAGINPVRITGSSEPLELIDKHVPMYGCGFVRSVLDMAGRGKYDYLDGVVIPNACDIVMRAEYWWRELVPKRSPTIAGIEVCPYVMYINYPAKITGRKVLDYFTAELGYLKQHLERFSRSLLTDEALRKAIDVYNEHYEYMRQLHEARKENPPLLSGYEAFVVEFSSLLMPKEDHNRLMKLFLAELLKRKDKPNSGVRLYLTASGIDAEAAYLYKVIEECGGQVVSEDIGQGTSYHWTTIDTSLPPLRAIAEHRLHIHCPRSTSSDPLPDHRYNFIKKTLEGYDIKGTIFYNLNYCECRALENPELRDKLREELGIPAVFLEGDYTREGLEQMRGRIEAFVEIVGG